MLHKNLLLAYCLLLTAFSYSQDLYIPRDINQAYQNNTRSKDGKPGANYWQNHGVYDINVNVSPPDRKVTGSETITYTNNSPDTLNVLSYKLILNGHKPGAARQGTANEDFLTSGVSVDKYMENGVEREWIDDHDETNRTIRLAKPLMPGASIDLTIDWHYDVSIESGREGAIDSTTYFLAYFYPRVAVYDDYEGWDRMTFTGSQEFYNDFNDYTVAVTVPKNYIVWATGDLQNTDEVLQKPYADLLKKSMESDSIFNIATPEDLEKKQITAQGETNTWRWKASNVTDFALALSDHYNWDAGSVVVDSTTNRRASVQAAFGDQSEDFHHMVEFGKHALNWFSNNTPGVPYPFSKSTIVRGFADMEYPMMVNDNSTPNLDFSRFVAEHEIAHTYFPFYMGINETRFGFMDEGWATALEHLISISDLGEETAIKNFQRFRVNRWINDNSMEEDLPIITPSNILSGAGLGNNEYGKAALGYLAVKDLLGDDLFEKALQGYMDRWHGKHPTPWDFFYSFNDITGENLNWFWDSWYFSHNYIDMAISNIDAKKGTVEIKNLGGMPAPFDITFTTASGETKTVHQSPKIWQNNLKIATLKAKEFKGATSFSINGGIFMDAGTSNNTWTAEKASK